MEVAIWGSALLGLQNQRDKDIVIGCLTEEEIRNSHIIDNYWKSRGYTVIRMYDFPVSNYIEWLINTPISYLALRENITMGWAVLDKEYNPYSKWTVFIVKDKIAQITTWCLENPAEAYKINWDDIKFLPKEFYNTLWNVFMFENGAKSVKLKASQMELIQLAHDEKLEKKYFEEVKEKWFNIIKRLN